MPISPKENGSADDNSHVRQVSLFGPLVKRIREGDNSASDELQKALYPGLGWLFRRELGSGPDAEDCVHETLLILIRAIQGGTLRDAECVAGFTRTVARRRIAQAIDQRVADRRRKTRAYEELFVSDPRQDAERTMIDRQKVELMKRVLLELSEKDREILTRFYLDEQPQEQICQEMDLTDTQFRLLKTRAKARFGELGRKKVAGRLNGLRVNFRIKTA